MVCCFMAMPSFAVNDNCPATGKLELQGVQNGKDDDFIYTNQDVYKEVLDCYSKYGAGVGKKSCDLKAGQVYECDKEQGCSEGKYIFGEKGWLIGKNGNFGKSGVSIEGKVARCKYGPDRWELGPLSECPDVLDQYWQKVTILNLEDRECYTKAGTYCCKKTGNIIINPYPPLPGPQPKTCDGTPDGGTQTSKGENCKNYMTNAEHVAWCYRTCNQGEWTDWQIHECENGYKKVDNRCVSKQDVPLAETKTCRETRQTNAGKACCDTPYVNNWDENTQTCSCGQGEKFEIDENNRGRCVKVPDNNDNNDNNDDVVSHDDNDNVVPQEYKCPELPFSNVDNCPEYTTKFQELVNYCMYEKPTQSGYEDKIAEMKRIIGNCKNNSSDAQRVTELTKGLFSKYDEMTGDVSVWKNKEGEFNTARLASDSIAGVVLGTAGGLITSNVVKKSQVKSGFEDVQCTIGGQKVADWGDEFTVGIQ